MDFHQMPYEYDELREYQSVVNRNHQQHRSVLRLSYLGSYALYPRPATHHLLKHSL